MRRLVAEGVTTFVELGPGTVLAGLIRKIDRSVEVLSVEDPRGFDALMQREAGSGKREAAVGKRAAGS